MTMPWNPESSNLELRLQHPVRFVTATSLFDGHDASINIMRRLLQAGGAEVIHLGHNRGVEEIVQTAIQEDAQGIAVSSYQGGHNEFFRYMVDLLRQKNAGQIQVFGGGGGVIIPREIEALMEYGVARIYSPEDGRTLGLHGMIADMLRRADHSSLPAEFMPNPEALLQADDQYLARCITWLEQHPGTQQLGLQADVQIPVIGITGTGGAGKSCITDELLRRFLLEFPEFRVAVISVDPSKRKTGGALLGDRIRMNALEPGRVYMRSLATRRAHLATSAAVQEIVQLLRASRFDAILLETAGIGQSDSEITELADVSIYVMTPEFGAATQLEKIDMLDFADVIVVNKCDKRSAEDALQAVRKQYRRNHNDFHIPAEQLPIFGTIASQFNDGGTNRFYQALVSLLIQKKSLQWKRHPETQLVASAPHRIIPPDRKEYLREISLTVRSYKQQIEQASQTASAAYQLYGVLKQVGCSLPAPLQEVTPAVLPHQWQALGERYNQALGQLTPSQRHMLQQTWEERANYRKEDYRYQVRGKTVTVHNRVTSLSGLELPKVAVPRFEDWGELMRWAGTENFPGSFPFTAGVFPFKRENEDPIRMFAGEGTPERTNRRFHYLSQGQPAIRLSTAFDSVTLYGENPHIRPDIYGKVGNAGVSVCTLDDAKRLYSGFDLVSPQTSVSMTINGPAPTILAFFLNAAIDQQVERYLSEQGTLEPIRHAWEKRYRQRGLSLPHYRGDLPTGHNGLGLGLLGISGAQVMEADSYQRLKSDVLRKVRGTVQADILKEDQAQNTCIFSTEFALRLMGDVQVYFSRQQIQNFYSVSVSGYHIAEAGANPISQVAFTLANGFTLIEYYLARGLAIDEFAHNLSFFFSNGMDPEYAVIGRVARRIFAVALRERYRANERSQKLKYHIQTSGRSLHAQEIDFNDIRTTLQALYAIYDNCNSLHTNAFDEAITTPTEASVRRAVAIQLIINRELGLAKNENPLQGSFIIEELTELVEEAILSEFVRISERGGVLGAMETMYQRNKIQEESLYYESLKHSGQLPIIGVNTFLNPNPESVGDRLELARSTEAEKQAQLNGLESFHMFHASEREAVLERLRHACLLQHNAFEALMEAVSFCSLGEITQELYRLGGQYRRNM